MRRSKGTRQWRTKRNRKRTKPNKSKKARCCGSKPSRSPIRKKPKKVSPLILHLSESSDELIPKKDKHLYKESKKAYERNRKKKRSKRHSKRRSKRRRSRKTN